MRKLVLKLFIGGIFAAVLFLMVVGLEFIQGKRLCLPGTDPTIDTNCFISSE